MLHYASYDFKITSISKIVNTRLAHVFDASYRYFRDNNRHAKGEEPVRAVYHATHDKWIDSIANNNLSMDHVGKTDPGYFGAGLYFSRHADYTFGYAKNDNEKKQYGDAKLGDKLKVIQFDIIPGRMKQIDTVTFDGYKGIPLTAGHDSHVTPNGFEFVMFDNRHILPRYIIEFEVVKSAGSAYPKSVESLGVDHPDSKAHAKVKAAAAQAALDASTLKAQEAAELASLKAELAELKAAKEPAAE